MKNKKKISRSRNSSKIQFQNQWTTLLELYRKCFCQLSISKWNKTYNTVLSRIMRVPCGDILQHWKLFCDKLYFQANFFVNYSGKKWKTRKKYHAVGTAPKSNSKINGRHCLNYIENVFVNYRLLLISVLVI
jgi:hypothetical protein